MDQPRPLFHLFSVFSNNRTVFTTNKCEKMIHLEFGAGIWTHHQIDYQSSPITTRQGLPPNFKNIFWCNINCATATASISKLNSPSTYWHLHPIHSHTIYIAKMQNSTHIFSYIRKIIEKHFQPSNHNNILSIHLCLYLFCTHFHVSTYFY